MKYCKIIKDLREDHDLTQLDVAKVLETTPQYYSKYEAGKNEMPFSRAIKLATFYNVSLDYLSGLITFPKALNSQSKQGITLTQKQIALLKSYEEHEDLQSLIDKALNISTEK